MKPLNLTPTSRRDVKKPRAPLRSLAKLADELGTTTRALCLLLATAAKYGPRPPAPSVSRSRTNGSYYEPRAFRAWYQTAAQEKTT